MQIRVIAALAALAVVPTFASASLIITEVAPQTTAGTASTINGDWWEVTNVGGAPINLSGYKWADTEDQIGGATPQPNLFPSIVINPGQSIIILEEAAANEAAWRTNWGIDGSVVILGTDEMLASPGFTDSFSGLGSTNDGVFLYDPSDTLLSSYLYAANTRGVSFEIDRAGNDLGLSVVGENGAVRALNGDVGSPGVSVPAPGAVAVIAAAMVGATRRRRAR